MVLSATHRLLFNALLVVLLSGVLSACTKEKDTTAIITVIRQDGTTVADANVRLFANPSFPLGDPSRLDQEKVTNGAGQAEFDYTDFYEQGQSGFAVLDIVCTVDSLVAEGIIKVVEEEINYETVVLMPVQ